MKKICSITTTANSMESFLLPEAIALKADGWESHIITNMNKKVESILPEGLKYYSIPMERTYNLRIAISTIIKMYRIFRKEKYDLVQYGTTHACLFGSIAAWLARVPARVFLQWGPIGYADYTGIRRFALLNVERLIGKLSTHIRTVSRKNLNSSVDDNLYPRDKASVVGEGGTIGVDLNRYDLHKKLEYRKEIRSKYEISMNEFVFGYVGRICKPKGSNELIEAFRELKSGEYTLMLIGDIESGFDHNLEEWAKQSSKVVMTDRISYDDVSKYMSALDILVHPTYREGFGMVLQECMAMEVPAITTNIPGPSEVIVDGVTGILVPVQNTEKLKEAMQFTCTHPEELKKMGVHGRKRVEDYFERNVRLSLLVEDKNQIYNQLKTK